MNPNLRRDLRIKISSKKQFMVLLLDCIIANFNFNFNYEE